MPEPIDILGLTSREFIRQASTRGLSAGQARMIYRAAFRGELSNRAPDWIRLAPAPVVNALHEHGTVKFIQRLEDGLETESVILPIVGSTGRLRHTLCVSSQIGCAMGCRFCETAQMGLMRNLTASQIVGQWYAARAMLRDGAVKSPQDIEGNTFNARPHAAAIDNIVFMGMGEPMDNLDNVIQAIGVLTDRLGPAIAPARISVSTVGRPAGILRLAQLARTEGYGKLRLAVSINAPNDAIRSSIMPINRATPMAELMDAMLQWPTDVGGGRQRVLIEYVLIPGVNDAMEHADELCEYLRPLRCTVNVIPYNPRRDSPWPAPSEEAVRAFVDRIHANGQFVKRRQTMGRSVMAACGQLGNPAIRRRKIVTQLTQSGAVKNPG